MPEFVHLHNHTHYSLLDGAATPETLLKAAAEQGHSAVALTDHGVMFGIVEFYKKAKKYGIKPILGCELYIAAGSRFDKSAGRTKSKNYYHLIALAKNEVGYRNLMKLSSIGHTEGFYYKPRIDKEVLERYSEGLVLTSACIGGILGAHFVRHDYDAARNEARWYKERFGADFYVEVQNHFLEFDNAVLEYAPKLARELGLKLVATNDCHYIKKEHALAHNVLLHIKDASYAHAASLDITRLRYGTPEYYFKTTDQMVELLGHIPGAIENTLEIAEKCTVHLTTDLHMPEFPIPPDSSAQTLDEYIEELTRRGIERRYQLADYSQASQQVRDRVEFELSVIKKMGFSGYFLIVQDFINAARRMGVSVGPGRGSAAGSLVAYALGITNVDPLQYDLLFERFLNPDRISMPDIDVDFNDEKRERVIQYVRDKYGEHSVAQIITFGTLSTKAVIKDVARVLGIPLKTVEQITKPIPTILGKVTPLKEALELPELRWVRESNDPKIQQLIEYASVLEGFARNSSLHAAGVVIAPGDISDYVPLYKSDSGIATQYNMKDLEDVGLLKMDFLGLRTLSIIDNTVAMIERNHGVRVDIDALDLFDKKTYEMLSAGKTLAVFQFESEPMQKYLKMLKPTCLEDLTAMNALYRPGPMDNIPEFCARKHGKSEIKLLHPLMEPALRTTYGIIVYQEQVMQLVRDLAGFSLAQADIMRRAMGKKDAKLMAEQKEAFIRGAQEVNNIDAALASEIFDVIEKFASYGFNKSHALAYSYLAFQTAWLKAHYPAEFLAANMTAELHDLDKIVALIDEAKYFGIQVLPPDVNESYAGFTAIPTAVHHQLYNGNARSAHSVGTIRFGLAAIKNVGEAAVESIIKARNEAPFRSFFDFAARVDTKTVNKRALEALVCAGGFDSLKIGHRAQLFAAIDDAIKFSNACHKSDTSMDTLFGDATQSSITEPKLPSVQDWSYFEKLKREREFLNFYVSGHPLERYRPHVEAFATLHLGNTISLPVGKSVRVCGIISSIRTKLDKKEKEIAFVQLEDFSGKAECILWSEAYARFRSCLVEDAVIVVSGKIDGSDSLKIVVDEIIPISEAATRFVKGVKIVTSRQRNTPEHIRQALRVVEQYPGKAEIFFTVYDEFAEDPTKPSALYRSQEMRMAPCDEAIGGLMKIFGHKQVKFSLD
ncbi:MAG: DNA polymerase III subunit alpha [Bacteroidota bacterium]|nr:DNA polymerase III subunit alpha [Candidatus Kapabacteria bacterium]MDW8220376.1 DNA polymerase III subunit alpha [Bacteroidota bacterium]